MTINVDTANQILETLTKQQTKQREQEARLTVGLREAFKVFFANVDKLAAGLKSARLPGVSIEKQAVTFPVRGIARCDVVLTNEGQTATLSVYRDTEQTHSLIVEGLSETAALAAVNDGARRIDRSQVPTVGLLDAQGDRASELLNDTMKQFYLKGSLR